MAKAKEERLETDKSFQSYGHQEILNRIIDDMMHGERRCNIIRKYCAELNRSENSVKRLVREAYESIAFRTDEDKEDLRALNLVRLTDLYSKCYGEQNWKDARSMIDTLNRTANLYDSNVNISQDDSFKFEFANEETPEEEETEEEEDEEASIWEG